MVVILLSMTGCDKEKKPEKDPEAAGEFVVDYMKEKYGVDFELTKSHKLMGQKYLEIHGKIPNFPYEETIRVEYDADSNKYIITRDLYSQEAIHILIDKWTSDLVEEFCDLNKSKLFCYCSYNGIRDTKENVPQDMETILSNEKNAWFQYYLVIPEDEFSSEKDVITKVDRLIKHLNEIGNDYSFEIDVYDNDIYDTISDNATFLDFFHGCMFYSCSTIEIK